MGIPKISGSDVEDLQVFFGAACAGAGDADMPGGGIKSDPLPLLPSLTFFHFDLQSPRQQQTAHSRARPLWQPPSCHPAFAEKCISPGIMATTYTDMNYQCVPDSYAWPSLVTSRQYTYPQYPSYSTMGRKKGASAYLPDSNTTDQPPRSQNQLSSAQLNGQEQSRRGSQRGNGDGRSESRVSRTTTYALLDWMKYQSDDTYYQNMAPPNPSPYFNPQNLHLPYRPPPQQVSASQHAPAAANQFNPQAANFLPNRRSVNAYQRLPSCRVDKHSRYNLRQRQVDPAQQQSARSTNTIVRSIEPHDPLPVSETSNPRWDTNRPRHSTPRRSTPLRPVTPPPAPRVSTKYLTEAQASPRKLDSPQKLLLVLDLNGTLLVRTGEDRQKFVRRPGLSEFLEYVFEHHMVMIWTSATAHNAKNIIKRLFTNQQQNKLLAVHARDTLGLTTSQYNAKVQVYKNLDIVWNDLIVKQSAPDAAPWSMANTVLLDDSILKAKAQPYNLIHIPEFAEYEKPPAGTPNAGKLHKIWKEKEESIMMSTIDKLEQLKMQANVACLIRQWQEGDKPAPGLVDETTRNISVVEQAIKAQEGDDLSATNCGPHDQQEHGKAKFEIQRKPAERSSAVVQELAAKDYPTPTSLRSASSESGDDEGVKLDPVPQPTIQQSLRDLRSPSPVTGQHFDFLKLK